MKNVTATEARKLFAQLLEEARNGETVNITVHGNVRAVLSPPPAAPVVITPEITNPVVATPVA